MQRRDSRPDRVTVRATAGAATGQTRSARGTSVCGKARGTRSRGAALCVLFAIGGCNAVGSAETGGHEPAGKVVSVLDYCASFAEAYVADNDVRLQPDSVRVEAGSGVAKWMSNAFQPKGSRFLAGRRCRFATASADGARGKVSVDLLVVETRAFAERARWENLQIVPVRYVEDARSGRSGYGVFKYVRLD